jgi:hypothetical protein
MIIIIIIALHLIVHGSLHAGTWGYVCDNMINGRED